MDSKRFKNKIVLRIDRGEELLTSIKTICEQHGVKLGSISGIGAIENANIGVYNVKTKVYTTTEITTEHEITNLSGTVSTLHGETYLHLHISLANPTTFGGHLNRALISATFEGVIDVIDGVIERKKDEETSLNFMSFKD